MLRLPRMKKKKNTETLQDLNVGENWPMNSIISRKMKYRSHIKCHSDI